VEKLLAMAAARKGLLPGCTVKAPSAAPPLKLLAGCGMLAGKDACLPTLGRVKLDWTSKLAKRDRSSQLPAGRGCERRPRVADTTRAALLVLLVLPLLCSVPGVLLAPVLSVLPRLLVLLSRS
jgi:hypothetical protein